MQIKAIMLYFLSEGDVERFDAENRGPDERYFTGLLPRTTTHFISQSDLQGDEHPWLAQEGYDHEEGFEIVFSAQDGEAVHAAVLNGLLENGYAVCAWPDRLLFQPNAHRILHMVETDLVKATLKLSPNDVSSVLAAFDHFVDAR